MSSLVNHWNKKKVSEVIIDFPIELNVLLTKVDLNILPLESYDVLIGMDWLQTHRSKVYCCDKVLECIDKEGRPRVVKGIPKKVLVR